MNEDIINVRIKNKKKTIYWLNININENINSEIEYHCEHGPAIEFENGYMEWWINGNQLSKEEFEEWLMKKDLNTKLHSMLPERPTEKKVKI